MIQKFSVLHVSKKKFPTYSQRFPLSFLQNFCLNFSYVLPKISLYFTLKHYKIFEKFHLSSHSLLKITLNLSKFSMIFFSELPSGYFHNWLRLFLNCLSSSMASDACWMKDSWKSVPGTASLTDFSAILIFFVVKVMLYSSFSTPAKLRIFQRAALLIG